LLVKDAAGRVFGRAWMQPYLLEMGGCDSNKRVFCDHLYKYKLNVRVIRKVKQINGVTVYRGSAVFDAYYVFRYFQIEQV